LGGSNTGQRRYGDTHTQSPKRLTARPICHSKIATHLFRSISPSGPLFMEHAVIVRAALAGASEDERAHLSQCSSAFVPGPTAPGFFTVSQLLDPRPHNMSRAACVVASIMWSILSTGFEAETHRQGVVVRDRDRNARAEFRAGRYARGSGDGFPHCLGDAAGANESAGSLRRIFVLLSSQRPDIRRQPGYASLVPIPASALQKEDSSTAPVLYRRETAPFQTTGQTDSVLS
jgi:hypothetical protein